MFLSDFLIKKKKPYGQELIHSKLPVVSIKLKLV